MNHLRSYAFRPLTEDEIKSISKRVCQEQGLRCSDPEQKDNSLHVSVWPIVKGTEPDPAFWGIDGSHVHFRFVPDLNRIHWTATGAEQTLRHTGGYDHTVKDPNHQFHFAVNSAPNFSVFDFGHFVTANKFWKDQPVYGEEWRAKMRDPKVQGAYQVHWALLMEKAELVCNGWFGEGTWSFGAPPQ